MSDNYKNILKEIREIDKGFLIGISEEESSVRETLEKFFDEKDLKEEVVEGNHFVKNSINWEHLNYGNYSPLETSYYNSLGFTLRRGSSQIPIASIFDFENYLDLSDENNLPDGITLNKKSNPNLSDFGPFFYNCNLYPLFYANESGEISNQTPYILQYSEVSCLEGESSSFSKGYLFFIPNTIFKAGNFSKARYLTLQFEIDFVFEYEISNSSSNSSPSFPADYSCLLDVLEFIGKYVAFGFEYSLDNITFSSLPISMYSTFQDSQIYFLDKYSLVTLNSSYFHTNTVYLKNTSFLNKGVLISLPINLFNRCLNRNINSKPNFPILMTNNSFLTKNGIDKVLPMTEYNRSPLDFKIGSSTSYKVYFDFKFGGFLKLSSSLFQSDSIKSFFEVGNCSDSTEFNNMFNLSNPLPFVSLFGGIFLRPKVYFPKFFYYFKDSPSSISSIFNNIGYSGSIILKNSKDETIKYTQKFKLSKIYNPIIFLSITNREILENYIIANRQIFI